MKKTLHILMNAVLLAGCVIIFPSCTSTDLTGFPPVAFTGTIDGKPIRVIYYPDKSKPVEVIYDAGTGPIEINLDK